MQRSETDPIQPFAASRAKVAAFLTTLSPWDLLYLRNEFRHNRISLNGLARLSDLPAEILCVIATHLTIDDVVNCRLVSRDWLTSWTQGAVITGISHFFFPGLLERHKELNDAQSAETLLQSSMVKYLRRRHARPHRSSFILWQHPSPAFRGVNAIDQLESGPVCFYSPGPPVFYDKGRIAWQTSGFSTTVDDLRTCERRDCNVDDVQMLQIQRLVLQGMSRELLVFVVKEGAGNLNYNSIQIWHVDLDKWKRVSLPGPFVRCFVEGERAAFVTRQGLVIAWSWEGGAIEVDVSGELNRPPEGYDRGRSLPGVILNPSKADTLYVASLFRSKPKGIDIDRGMLTDPQPQKRRFLMSVVRYQDGKPTGRYQELIHDESLSNNHHHSIYVPFRITLLCSKMDANGLYNLGTLLGASYDIECPRVVELATAGFNIYKEAFVQRKFIHNNGNDVNDRPEFRLEPSIWGLSDHEELLTTWSQDHATIPRWVSLDSADRTVKGVKAAADVALYLKELQKCVPVLEPCRVLGDDDFQVFVTTHGILVWSFTDDTKLPVTNGPGGLRNAVEQSTMLAEPVPARDLRPFAG